MGRKERERERVVCVSMQREMKWVRMWKDLKSSCKLDRIINFMYLVLFNDLKNRIWLFSLNRTKNIGDDNIGLLWGSHLFHYFGAQKFFKMTIRNNTKPQNPGNFTWASSKIRKKYIQILKSNLKNNVGIL